MGEPISNDDGTIGSWEYRMDGAPGAWDIAYPRRDNVVVRVETFLVDETTSLSTPSEFAREAMEAIVEAGNA